ncbi:hypothetical protein IP88_03380 [alpha proteobacterium AAP81b]|nr:hypothetical protein IP88_03380 [alpha proteobacterium AAP81b]
MDLLYISGSGRSGSTLVERLLHASQRFVAVGEFHVLWRLPHDQITCSCGARLPDDPFWQPVLASAGIGAPEIAELARLEARVARTGRIAAAGFSLDRLRDDPEVTAFLAPQLAILAAVARAAGRDIVVDSSKAGPRAFVMATLAASHSVHLWRHPTAVIASWRSKKFDQGLGTLMARPGIPAAAADWWKVEQLARRLAREAPVAMVDYDRLCADPAPVLAQALAAAGIAGDAGIPWADSHSVVAGAHYHSLNGNPDRFDRGPIRVAARSVDWSKQSAADRLLVPAAGALLGALYPRPG